MPITAVTFTCDRDGTAQASVSDELPNGWQRVLVSGAILAPTTGFLCPQCVAAFGAFMTASGGGAAFNPKPPSA